MNELTNEPDQDQGLDYLNYLGWYRVELPDAGNRRVPRWRRSVGVDRDGEMWVPTIYAGDEKAVLLRLSPNTQGAILCDNHIYVRTSWMRREYPDTIELLEKIRQQVREITDRENDNWLTYRLAKERGR